MKILSAEVILRMLKREGFSVFMKKAMDYIEADFKRWDEFGKVERLGSYFKDGVIELMPIWDDRYYAYKYVNGHPRNCDHGKQTVIGLGQLSDVGTGYPLILSDMTILTAIRTACVSGIASRLMGKKTMRGLSLIGTGSQSEFQVIAHLLACRSFEVIQYYDRSKKVMDKFEWNMKRYFEKEKDLKFIRCKGVDECIEGMDCITTATTSVFTNQVILKDEQVKAGVHINGLGGDAVGKTELDKRILKRAKISVEYLEQTKKEGEIQQLSCEELDKVDLYELHEIIKGVKVARKSDKDITLFDSVGFAIEDFSILKLVKDLEDDYQMGVDLDILVGDVEPGDLFSLLWKNV